MKTPDSIGASAVDPDVAPRNHEEVISDRKLALEKKTTRDNFRTPRR